VDRCGPSPEASRLRPRSTGVALDIGCGTGQAFPPLLKRGWDICGCDISPAMVTIAKEHFGNQVRLSVADMRRLPTLGSFDLVLAMNDTVNHLLTDRDLHQTMAGVAKNLSPSGLLVFDCNTRALFRELFDAAERRAVERGGRRWIWRGMGEGDLPPPTFRAQISGDSIDPITITERHFSQREIERHSERLASSVEASSGSTRLTEESSSANSRTTSETASSSMSPLARARYHQKAEGKLGWLSS